MTETFIDVAKAASESPLSAKARSESCRYLTVRLLDALLREDVQGLVSQGLILTPDEAIEMIPALADLPRTLWLCRRFPHGELWMAVQSSAYMQSWRSVDGQVWCLSKTRSLHELEGFEAILDFLLRSSDIESHVLYQAYIEECWTAVEHRFACEKEKSKWFASWQDGWPNLIGQASLLFFDRLAAFLDHPYYPSARAKSGLKAEDLSTFAPEFSPVFELQWVAVPRACYRGIGERWPEFWPGFETVGLSPDLVKTHVLIPVHPFMWRTALMESVADSSLAGQVIVAPRSYLDVKPTLSVRSLVVDASPDWHIKLPLNMRTLGSKNIRLVKPGTIVDGDLIQRLLTVLTRRDDALEGRMLLTDEGRGGHANGENFLGFILRRYDASLNDATLLPVAALVAEGADCRLAIENLADRFYQGDLSLLVTEYIDITLKIHLQLWLKYGIALESNQQNSMLVLWQGRPMQLLFKDNDAARILQPRLKKSLQGDLQSLSDDLAQLQDRRVLVDNELALAQMFTTITLQLNIAEPLYQLSKRRPESDWFNLLRQRLALALETLEQEGIVTSYAREVLQKDEWLYAKYLLRAGSLESKASTGAADINKFYGKTAPNFLKAPV